MLYKSLETIHEILAFFVSQGSNCKINLLLLTKNGLCKFLSHSQAQIKHYIDRKQIKLMC